MVAELPNWMLLGRLTREISGCVCDLTKVAVFSWSVSIRVRPSSSEIALLKGLPRNRLHIERVALISSVSSILEAGEARAQGYAITVANKPESFVESDSSAIGALCVDDDLATPPPGDPVKSVDDERTGKPLSLHRGADRQSL